MIIPPAPPDAQPGRAIAKSLGHDFALLGLKAQEARVDVIRQAARNTAARIQELAEQDEGQRESMLGDLATSTYRLLDPRRRHKPLERIQLSIFSESDFELQQQSRASLLPRSHPFVVAELVEVESHHEAQLREAKREIVQQLLEHSRANRHRMGAITISSVAALSLAVAGVAVAILF